MARVLSLAILASCITLQCSAEEPTTAWWPQFRGPNGSGVASGDGYPTELDHGKNSLWKTEVPSGVSSPCIWDDRIFLTAHDEERDKLETICIARDSGAVLWRKDAPAEEIEKVHAASSPASGTPVTDGHRVYVYFGSYGLECYDFDGNLVWTKPLGMAKNRWGMGTSPILANDLLILTCDQGGGARSGVNRVESATSYLLATRASTGQTAWRIERPGIASGWSTPIIWKQPEGDQLVVYSTMRAIGYSIESGAELWWVNRLPYDSVGTPVVGEGLLFVSGTVIGGDEDNPIIQPFDELLKIADHNGDGSIGVSEAAATRLDPRDRGTRRFLNYGRLVESVDADKDGFASREEWEDMRSRRSGGRARRRRLGDRLVAIKSGADGNATQSHVAWQINRGIPDNPSPLYYDGHIYLVKSGGILSCFEASSGKRVYQKRIGFSGKVSASPVAADGVVYAVSEDGQVVVFRAGASGDILQKNNLKERIMATPALVDGKVYVRTEANMYAFGT